MKASTRATLIADLRHAAATAHFSATDYAAAMTLLRELDTPVAPVLAIDVLRDEMSKPDHPVTLALVVPASAPSAEVRIHAPWSSGGCTGFDDYLMTDYSIRTLKTIEIKKGQAFPPNDGSYETVSPTNPYAKSLTDKLENATPSDPNCKCRQLGDWKGFHHPLCEASRATPADHSVPVAWEMDWPDYSYGGMGCGLEDRGITDRYEAMKYGWDEAMERVGFILNRDAPLYATPQPPQPEAQSVRDAELEALRELQCCVESQIAQGNSVLAIEACIERLGALKSAPSQNQ